MLRFDAAFCILNTYNWVEFGNRSTEVVVYYLSASNKAKQLCYRISPQIDNNCFMLYSRFKCASA